MRIQIIDIPIRHNVELFLDILRHAKQKEALKSIKSNQLFRAWINRKTGRFFASDDPSIAKEEWKPIEIRCVYDPSKGEICFLVEEIEGKKRDFHYDDLTPKAYAIMRETFQALNDISSRLNGPSDFETKIAVMLKLQIDGSVSSSDQSLLLEAWHPIDRFHAESLLWDKPFGTYLFRKDPYAEMLEEQLQQHYGQKVKCFTLTYSQPGKKFSDLTLVHFKGTWQIYNDDPMLEEAKFSALLNLLEDKKDILKHPLYHFN